MYKMRDYLTSSMYDIAKHYLMSNFLHRCTNLVRETPITSVLNPENDVWLPLVVLIGGVGGAGKSSFIEYCKQHIPHVYEESTIDCCKSVAAFMSALETNADIGSDEYFTLADGIDLKSDTYRTFLNELKSIWCKFDDGPNRITINAINNIFTHTLDTSIVFVNVREPEQIAYLKDCLEALHYLVVTMSVTRSRVTPPSNDADQHTMEYVYDINILNEYDLDVLNATAKQFCCAVQDMNFEVVELYDRLVTL